MTAPTQVKKPEQQMVVKVVRLDLDSLKLAKALVWQKIQEILSSKPDLTDLAKTVYEKSNSDLQAAQEAMHQLKEQDEQEGDLLGILLNLIIYLNSGVDLNDIVVDD